MFIRDSFTHMRSGSYAEEFLITQDLMTEIETCKIIQILILIAN